MKFESVWSYDKLWLKAKVYMQKAFDEDRDGDMFPFWSAIALEFVARATLASVHPALLASPQEGSHILYVFGYYKPAPYKPISIPTKTVLERCKVVVVNFTDNEKTFCEDITSRRNEELHSGGLGFDSYPTSKWLSKYFKVLKILLEFQGKTLEDFLGKDESKAAEEMIAERDATLEKSIRDRISKHSKSFSSLALAVQTELIEKSKAEKWFAIRHYRKDLTCPACSNLGVLSGKLISVSESIAGESEIIQNLNVLPTHFKCFCCDLELHNHTELDVIELGGQYKVEEIYDPREYFEIEDREQDFDYGND